MTCQSSHFTKNSVHVTIAAVSDTVYLLFSLHQMETDVYLTKGNMKSHLTSICFVFKVGTIVYCLSITGLLEKLQITVGPTLPVRLPSCSVMLHSLTPQTGTVLTLLHYRIKIVAMHVHIHLRTLTVAEAEVCSQN